MSVTYKRDIPLAISSLLVIFLFIGFFIEHPVISQVETRLLGWGTIIIAISLMVGVVNILLLHGRHIMRKTPGQWIYSLALVLSIVIFLGVTIPFGTLHPYSQALYLGVVRALSSGMHSLNLFYISWAAYRTFKFRTVDSSILMASAVFTMFYMVPVGRAIWGGFPIIGLFLDQVVNKAGTTAIVIGVGIGILVQAVRLIRGKERGFLGPQEEY